MVWFYGGGFVIGTSSEDAYGPDYLIQRDIVLITINYRVGALGKHFRFIVVFSSVSRFALL